MPIKFICKSNDYLYIEDYIYDNFREIEVIFYDKNNTTILCEQNTYYVSLVSVPHINNSIQHNEYKNALIDMENDIHKLSGAALITPVFSKNCNIALLNTEHLSNSLYLKYLNEYVPKTMEIYDFSQKNIEILGRGIYIPYKNNPISTNILKSYIKQKKQTDVCIIGNMSKRRRIIMDKLMDNRITVDFIYNDFRASRDRRVGRCKLLLNIHMYENTVLYEAIRCERWRFAGMPIVSETCMDEVPEGIITCDYDKIVETVKEVLRKMNN
jgi:hypothetical protein